MKHPLSASNLDLHTPVMRSEAIEALNIQPNGVYWDGTFGRGGHAKAVLERLDSDRGGQLLASDRDLQAAPAAETLKIYPNFTFISSRFSKAVSAFQAQGLLVGQLDGILLDLGVSSPQLDQAERGFSFLRDGPLDMRMEVSPDQPTACQWLNSAHENDIAIALKELGEERHWRCLTKAIVAARKKAPITRTKQLADLVTSVLPRTGHIHPATKTFQALRMVVNQELAELSDVIEQSAAILKPSGRLVILTFHGLEARVARQAVAKFPRLQWITKSPPSYAETRGNPRARSAWLRVAEAQ